MTAIADNWSGISREEAMPTITRTTQAAVGGLVFVDFEKGRPVMGVVQAYVRAALRRSRVEETDPGVWMATVDGLQGIYGLGSSAGAARRELADDLPAWIGFLRERSVPVPVIDGLNINSVR